MSRYDFTTQRLFIDAPLGEGARIVMDKGQTNYLVNVLRMREGDPVLIFNGRDGEWQATLAEAGRKGAVLTADALSREQTPASRLMYLFAPIKQARLDYMVQKAVEMGVGHIRPVITRRTQVARLNDERLRANAIEAAEQCGVLSIPEIDAPEPLAALLARWPKDEPERHIVFCDEDETGADPISILRGLPKGPLAVLIGPEGGFSPEEREALHALPFVTAIPLGPRILRADTAAVAALALVQAVAGDWTADAPGPLV
ncbi:16S rRNA (uracil(1498)-N(3))-methyltransferase [Kaistia defluvii]|uniref:16S rRNA (uracil(1498)-N(3))-methyltransferase n=1 Tax=Kaistia defluvii TaxID=410841 RepID=UPI002251AA68|nr:16S rRNA (uracil(1498)-N(3))-methyltransferase [Kaistia defluvii]MCX5518176.1 16S rRNA (uracil(1498)-N(3))-methyltransferase [Kaistia defluvii]